ncbi:MAG: Cobalt-zinc-cadmium resistance protein CzcD [Halanaerobium sp. 4-GBenrich]|jgi:Co/Zn/Cd efflux system component|uniref:Cation efflux family protein n=1 Tax=Halanaerobium congolense TaxID=54121 RepID=A0A1G6K7I5_9FIRM|nr:cation transporter [Halanaerobium congolense]ODS50577.1 MAG: Cobalt-zinc-cadmium resistance protein CzcD [Halanaerobium sp. 4-GBenrich]PUU91482.1 MAG: Cobalt-zinc-cadmium resistance protein CzcD [Halanaerobium sp.]TDS26381.1 cation efflux family protein [Halanaerobium congolense]SDC26934.1 Cation efflux family protein [Halanaerobium congolense]SDH18448.1 Cation efflux family protein [Halanaerobium congolense]
MYKSIFTVKKMDCPSEKNLIETKLGSIKLIQKLDFDLEKRKLIVFHSQKDKRIKNYLNELKLDSKLEKVVEIQDENNEITNDSQSQKKLLKTVLLVNFGFFLFEMTAGLIANSMGLVADSLDMFSDSIVYLVSLFAVGGSILLKKKVAKLAGYFQIFIASFGFIEVLRRFFGFGEMPDFSTMIIVSILAFIANLYCLYLFQKSDSKEAHMKASWIFTSNDLIVNSGVIISGLLVYFFDSNKPDLIIGGIVFIVVINGARKILNLAK